MPTYDYECSACGARYEVFQSIKDKPQTKCEKCGKKKARRLIGSGAGLIFKGSGFYITDYRNKEYGEAAKKDSASAESKPADAKPKTSDAKSADAKPADAKAADTKSADTKPTTPSEKPKPAATASKSAKKRRR